MIDRAEAAGRLHGTELLLAKTDPALEPWTGPGLRRLRLPHGREALAVIPDAAKSTGRYALLVMLHGAGGNPEQVLSWFPKGAGSGVVLLVPHSVGRTWDLVIGDFGADAANLDCALSTVISHLPIDPLRLGIGGFSDGASYALSVGIRNGAVMRHVIAFSPGFVRRSSSSRKPSIFISHGRQDTVLPIEQCGRSIAAELRMEGYRVDYREFDGGHIIPEPMMDAGLAALRAL